MKNKRMKYIWAAAALLLPLTLLLQHVFAKDSGKIAYITFDDGPTLNTPDIVKTLEEYNAKATFFVLEERIVMYPDFIKQIEHSGSALGLHGVSHSEAIYYTATSPLEEMEKTNKALKSVLGKGSKLVRVPFGSSYRLTKQQADILKKNGYIIWDWNVDPRDSVGTIIPEKVMANLRRDLIRCTTSPVILLHDRKSTAKLLPHILKYLSDEGYTMMPISEKQTAYNFVKK
ncbi:MAG: hypothetical protein E7392_06295 [Ruminococcaceae bacterium]|nr:hypothetical protein [Oscillospiraceae bacterium]